MTMNGNDKTLQRKRAFLLAFAEVGTISHACEVAKMSRECYYRWTREDSEFVEGYKLARESFIDRLEKEAYRRAHEGVDEPVFYKGELVTTVRKYSDILLMFLLKGAAPDKYRDNSKLELSGKVGVEIKEVEVRLSP